MQILKNKTHYDFIGKRKPALFISTVLNIAILVGLAIFGFNLGVDFAGGTVVELKFKNPISAEKVRERAKASGQLHDISVQQIGSAAENSYLLRLGGVTQLTPDRAAKASDALKPLGAVGEIRRDLDNGLLSFRSDKRLDPAEVEKVVEASGTGVSQVRFLGEAAGGAGFDYQVAASGMADEVVRTFSLNQPTDPTQRDFEVQRVDYVGPQVGKQLRNKGIVALLYAMIAILIYVAFRFDFKFAPGAIAAMPHDVVMVCGYYLIGGFFGREFNLTSIAALLTIVGYSINDTIVIYDRIREEMVRFKGKPLPEIINIAVNDTLSRTILTSGVTALSLIGLLIFGVGEIWDFAMAMLVGIIVGTYSSVYIASPLTIWLDERAATKQGGAKQSMKTRAA